MFKGYKKVEVFRILATTFTAIGFLVLAMLSNNVYGLFSLIMFLAMSVIAMFFKMDADDRITSEEIMLANMIAQHENDEMNEWFYHQNTGL